MTKKLPIQTLADIWPKTKCVMCKLLFKAIQQHSQQTGDTYLCNSSSIHEWHLRNIRPAARE